MSFVIFQGGFIIKFTESATVLAAASAYLYSASTAYVNGYFQILNLDADVLERSFHQTLYHGLVINLKSLIYVPFWIAAVVVSHSLFCLALTKILSKPLSQKRIVVKVSRFLGLPRKKPNRLQKLHFKRIQVSVLVFTFIAILLGSLAKQEKDGREFAKQIESNIQTINSGLESKENVELEVIRVSLAGVEKEIFYLYCGARNCAGYDSDNNEVIYFGQSTHSKFTRNITSE